MNDTSLLSQELEPLNLRIAEVKSSASGIAGELCGVEVELETFAAERVRVEALEDTCAALSKLHDLEAGELFWEGLGDNETARVHNDRLRGRIDEFKAKTVDLEEKRESLREQLNRQNDELDDLFYEVSMAYDRDERRQEEFVVEREASFLTYKAMVMPWSKDVESEGRFRRALLVLLLFCLLFGGGIPLINVPLPDRAERVVEIPERLAMLLKEKALVATPAPPPPEEKRVESEKEEAAEPEKAEVPAKPKEAESEQVAEAQKAPEEPKPKAEAKPAQAGRAAAKKRAEKMGVLAFKSDFSDLMDEVPVAKLGSEASVKKDDKRAPGQARAQRSLVAIQAEGGSGSSGGISNYGVSRDLGHGGSGGGDGYGTAGSGGGAAGQIDGVGLADVESSLADLTAEEGRPLSEGPSAGRTDEEIQIVFDRYKATLYRIYNKELRKDPTLRGKLLLRITIEPDGSVSFCKVESTDLDSPELVAKIVARVGRFNFGPKDDVPPTNIIYPIDFLPAG